jgi:hypothetical protein
MYVWGMKPGRKPQHSFYDLKIGKKALLTGSAAVYPHQFIYQYNKKHPEKLRVLSVGNNYFAERII